MKLFYAPNSPCARVARTVVRESGLIDRVSEERAANRQPVNPVLAISPVGRVPVLVDGDLIITETKPVYDYLLEASGVRSAELSDRSWRMVAQDGQILGILEGIACWVRELRRDAGQRSEFLLGVEGDRAIRCLEHLNANAANRTPPEVPIFRAVALSAALGLMDLHQFVPDWPDRYDDLFH